jgi:hypothetical protein
MNANRRVIGTRLAGLESVLAAILGIFAGGCASGGGLGRDTQTSPSANATVTEAWRDAQKVSAQGEGRSSAMGSGDSMQPVYGPTSVMVITPIAYADLKPGMNVAYMNERGVKVVHKLVSKDKEGWRIVGLNNERIDRELVTPRNLVGVIYASFNYSEETPPN